MGPTSSSPYFVTPASIFGRNLTKEKLISSALFVREELPTRLAHRIRDMQLLPYSVLSNPHLCKVYEMCYAAFDKFRKVPKLTVWKKWRILRVVERIVGWTLVCHSKPCNGSCRVFNGEFDRFWTSRYLHVFCSQIPYLETRDCRTALGVDRLIKTRNEPSWLQISPRSQEPSRL